MPNFLVNVFSGAHSQANLPIPDCTRDRTPTAPNRPSSPQGNQCSISHFLASLGAQEN